MTNSSLMLGRRIDAAVRVATLTAGVLWLAGRGVGAMGAHVDGAIDDAGRCFCDDEPPPTLSGRGPSSAGGRPGSVPDGSTTAGFRP